MTVVALTVVVFSTAMLTGAGQVLLVVRVCFAVAVMLVETRTVVVGLHG